MVAAVPWAVMAKLLTQNRVRRRHETEIDVIVAAFDARRACRQPVVCRVPRLGWHGEIRIDMAPRSVSGHAAAGWADACRDSNG